MRDAPQICKCGFGARLLSSRCSPVLPARHTPPTVNRQTAQRPAITDDIQLHRQAYRLNRTVTYSGRPQNSSFLCTSRICSIPFTFPFQRIEGHVVSDGFCGLCGALGGVLGRFCALSGFGVHFGVRVVSRPHTAPYSGMSGAVGVR